jgi:hypothetical protein
MYYYKVICNVISHKILAPARTPIDGLVNSTFISLNITGPCKSSNNELVLVANVVVCFNKIYFLLCGHLDDLRFEGLFSNRHLFQ